MKYGPLYPSACLFSLLVPDLNFISALKFTIPKFRQIKDLFLDRTEFNVSMRCFREGRRKSHVLLKFSRLFYLETQSDHTT
ncbi:hypothetical protein HZS_7427 [Henneguya salminicola]|nr:hypothetical protein HZS_7427 [Henneguya salminicola]